MIIGKRGREKHEVEFSVKQQPDVSAHYPVECERCLSVYCINLHDLRGIQSDRVPPVRAMRGIHIA